MDRTDPTQQGPSSYRAVWERLYRAVRSLVGSPGRINERLCNACVALGPLRPKDFPPEPRVEFEAILKELSCVDARGEAGDFKATIDQMTEETATTYAERIFDLYVKAEKDPSVGW